MTDEPASHPVQEPIVEEMYPTAESSLASAAFSPPVSYSMYLLPESVKIRHHTLYCIACKYLCSASHSRSQKQRHTQCISAPGKR